MHRNHVLLSCFWLCASVHAAAAAGVAAKRRPNSQLWHGDEPLVARISGIVVALLASSACAAFFCAPSLLRRNSCFIPTGSGEELAAAPPHGWCKSWTCILPESWDLADSFAIDRPPSSTDLLFIYVDSFSFIMGSVILQYAFDTKNDSHWCAAATLLCICGYLTGKVCISFLQRAGQETTDICRNAAVIFCAFMTVFFVYRFSHVEDGACIIGIEQRALVIPVAFDVFVSRDVLMRANPFLQIYLSVLFIIPLMKGTWNVEFELKGRTMSLGTQAMMAHPASARLRSSRQRVGHLLDHVDQGLVGLGQVARHLDGTPVLDLPPHHGAGQPAGIRRPRRLAAPGPRLGPAPSNPDSVSRAARPTDLSIDDILYGMENTDDFVRRKDNSPRGKHPNLLYTEGLEDLREEAEKEEEEEKKEDPWYCSVPNGDAAAHTDTYA
ncbi:Ring finger domain protein [Apiospora sp. TS-2023a]